MPAAALALLLIAAGARAEEAPPDQAAAAAAFTKAHPDLGQRFTKEWRRLLETVPELAPHRDFLLRQRKVELIFSDPGPTLAENTVASYLPGVVRINRRWLSWAGHELESRGIPYSRIPGLLAWKLLPTLAHELRHGITEEEMRAEVGDICKAFVVENEVVSFYDNVQVGRAALRRNPAAFADDVLLGSLDQDLAGTLAAYRSSRTGLYDLVARLYTGRLSAVRSTREQLLADAESSRERVAKELAAYRAADAAGKASTRDAYGPDPEGELKRSLDVYAGCGRVFADAEESRRFRDFYKDRMEALEEDWRP